MPKPKRITESSSLIVLAQITALPIDSVDYHIISISFIIPITVSDIIYIFIAYMRHNCKFHKGRDCVWLVVLWSSVNKYICWIIECMNIFICMNRWMLLSLYRSIIASYKFYNLILFITLKVSKVTKPGEFTFVFHYNNNNNYEHFSNNHHCQALHILGVLHSFLM